MNGVLKYYLDKFVIVFKDDILVYSTTKEEHEYNLKMALHVLREHQLYANLRKCTCRDFCFEELVLWTHKGFMEPQSTSTLDKRGRKIIYSMPTKKKSESPAGGRTKKS